MGWKDSGDSVMYPDGSLVKGPKALCELQGYVYNAWVRMAEVFDALGKADRATELRAKAAALFARFNEVFWDEELGFYTYALDGDKNKHLKSRTRPRFKLNHGLGQPVFPLTRRLPSSLLVQRNRHLRDVGSLRLDRHRLTIAMRVQ